MQFCYAKNSGPVRNAALAVHMSPEEIDQRISAAEAEVARLGARLDQIRQDSINAAIDMQAKMSSYSGKNSPLESQHNLKNQELTALHSQRDKARQDSLSAATKQYERTMNSKKESARLEATVMSASNQLNALTTRRQALPTGDAGGESKSVNALQREIARADSAIRAKQNDIASFSKKRDQFHQDSLLQESESAEIRKHSLNEGKRLDSLILAMTQAMSEVSGKQGKGREGASAAQAQEQARLSDLTRQKAVVDAQIARTKGEITAVNSERDRLKALSGSSQKKNEAARAPLASALTSSEDELQVRMAEKDALTMLMEKVRLDSAIAKAKNNLDAAIEQRARGKRGAEKLVDQREGEVTTLMGQLDDVVRKQPKVAQFKLQISGLTSTELKRKQVETMTGQASAEIATLTARRDQAKQSLDDFDKSHPGSANPSSQRITQLDSSSSAKEKSITALLERSDSLAVQVTASQHTLEGLTSSVRSESAKADSGAAQARKQKTELIVQRAQLRADSMKNESTGMVAVMKIKTEQAKLNAQYSMLDREIATLSATKEKLKQAIVDAQSRDKLTKAANQQEHKKLDSLIDVKEQEVSSLSMQSEKASQEAQNASKETELALQKQIAALAVLGGQITAKTQEIASLNQQLDVARKAKAAAEKAGTDKIRAVEQDKLSTISGLESKKAEIATLKQQKEEIEKNAVRQREEQERAVKRLHDEQELEAKRAHDQQERAAKREFARYDSLVNAANQRIVTIEARREKARQDSINAESLKTEAIGRSVLALRKHDSLNTARQQQLAELTDQLEKAKQDSITKSSVQAGSVSNATKSVDSLIAIKEKEMADLRQQREKARQEGLEEQRKQAAVLLGAHQDINSHRTLLLQKKAEVAISQNERRRLQQDSVAATSRGQAAAQLAAAEIAQDNTLIEKKKTEIASLQTQRDDAAAKASALGAVPPPAIAPAPVTAPVTSTAALGPADAAQKQMEEIYMLIGGNKIEDAINRFKEQKANLVKYVNPEAFKVLKSTIDQLTESVKKTNSKKR